MPPLVTVKVTRTSEASTTLQAGGLTQIDTYVNVCFYACKYIFSEGPSYFQVAAVDFNSASLHTQHGFPHYEPLNHVAVHGRDHFLTQ